MFEELEHFHRRLSASDLFSPTVPRGGFKSSEVFVTSVWTASGRSTNSSRARGDVSSLSAESPPQSQQTLTQTHKVLLPELNSQISLDILLSFGLVHLLVHVLIWGSEKETHIKGLVQV